MSFDLFAGSHIPPLLQQGDCRIVSGMPAWQLKDLDVFQSQYRLIYPYTDMYGNTSLNAIDAAGMGRTLPEAQFLCFMELVERFSALSDATIRNCLNTYTPTAHHISWERLCPYSAEQVHSIRQAYNPALEPLVNARGLLSGLYYSLPAFCVFPRWKSYVHAYPLPIPESDGSGIAGGFTWEQDSMIKRALCEVIERDCVLLSWRVPGWKASIIRNPPLQEAQQKWIRSNKLVLTVYNVGEPGLIPVVMAVLGKEKGVNITIGSSCGKGKTGDVQKAVSEAIMLQSSATQLDKEYGPFEDNKIDCSEMHVVYAWRNGPAIADWYKKKAGKNAFKGKDWDITLPELLNRCLKVYGSEPVLIELTDPRMRNMRYRVVRAVQPNAYKKEYLHTYMYRGGKRLEAHLGQDALNTLPHPIG
jgi:hypothetical protein